MASKGEIISAVVWLGLLSLARCDLQKPRDEFPTRSRHTRPEACRWNPLGPLRPQGSTVCHPVVDDESAGRAGNWEPWTHKPICLRGERENTTRYCTFTDASFRRGHGLSIIGTPEDVAGFADTLDEPFVPWDPRRRPHIPRIVDLDEGPPYTVMEVPGKGKGVVARRLIRAGEILMTDHPVVIAGMEFPKVMSAEQGRYLLKLAVDQLPNQDLVYSLAGSTGGEIIENILRTNTFGIGINNVTYMGLYPEISRINHACIPNAFSRFHPTDLTMDVGAVRDIQPWEEITISYIPLGLPSWNRAQSIQDWGFACSCDLCSSQADNDLSDGFRGRLNELRLELDNHESLEYESLVDVARDLVRIVEIESMTPHLGDYYEALSIAFEAKGDLKTALWYEEMSLDKWRHYGGEDHAHVPNVERRIRALKGEMARKGKKGRVA